MTEERKIEVADQPVVETTPTAPRKPLPTGAIVAIVVIAGLSIGVIGFACGVQYQKLAVSNSTPTQGAFGDSRQGFAPRRGMNMNGTLGTVTTVSDSSITVTIRQRFNSPNNSSNSTTKTYTINSSTHITVDGETAKASDIKTGETIVIEASSSDSTIASSIRVGMGGPGTQQSSSADTTDTTSRTN